MLINFFQKRIYLVILFSVIFLINNTKFIYAKISDRNATNTFWQVSPVMPGAAKYFIRTEKIEKKTKNQNNHPINISGDVLRKMFKQLSYKYDRNEPEIPLFSNKELLLLSEHVPKALKIAKPNEDVTFVIKGPHKSARWSFTEDRLTAGRIFISNNQLNLILGAVQVGLQPTLDEQYQGNVWETARLTYDIGHRRKSAKYEGLILVYNKNKKGIYRKSNERKDWFVFTNTAYKNAKENIDSRKLSGEQYKTLQQQIDSLQKELNNKSKSNNQINQNNRQNIIKKHEIKKNNPNISKRKPTTNENSAVILEQRLKTIDNLYKKGMLSESEYNRKRQEILKGI